MSINIVIRALWLCLLISAQALALPLKVGNDFPRINQQTIAGASERCGTIALGSWFLWLGEHGTPELLAERPLAESPFAVSTVDPSAQATLSQLDTILGGTQEIKLQRLIEGGVAYFHQQPTEELELVMRYFNLPDEEALRRLNESGAAVILLHGTYRTNATTDELARINGHYTCLTGQSEEGLTINTYARDFTFSLTEIPMLQLQSTDRYKAKGMESMIHIHYPKADYPRYQLRVYAAAQSEFAQMLQFKGGQSFARPDETVLLEGALALWIERR
ncbi:MULTISPECIES: hypothetical protein [unclassified Lentimonas]|uniref:hypothetical protein n=1 Tax=unclassified Lentimonas TaxID=2630993 RepID=UPI0013898845|nr:MULTISPECIES: hypothetical protein [unclassified Lentimonas]